MQKISGYKTLAMVLRYAHVSDPHIDEAIRASGERSPMGRERDYTGTTAQSAM